MRTSLLTQLVVVALLPAFAARAAPPPILHHQGRIVVNGANFGSPTPQTGHFKFALLDGAGTETFWTNDGTNTGSPGGEPTASVGIQVERGFYSAELGNAAIPNMVGVPTAVFTDHADVRLRIWFSSDDVSFDQLAPDRRILTTGYAFSAGQAESVPDGSITTEKLASGIRPRIETSGGEPEAAGPANTGMLYFDTTTGKLTVSDGTRWEEVGRGVASPAILWKGEAGSSNTSVGTWEALALTATVSPPNGEITYDAPSAQLTIQAPGYYDVRVAALRDNTSASLQAMRLLKNGSAVRSTRATAGGEYEARIDETVDLDVGDTLKVELRQEGAGTNWTAFNPADGSGTSLQVRFVGAQ